VKNTINYEQKRRYLPPNIIANIAANEIYMDIPILIMYPTHLVICIWSLYCARIVRFSYTNVCGVVIMPTKSLGRLVGWVTWSLGHLVVRLSIGSVDINIIPTYIIIQWEIYIHVSPIINHASFAMNDLQNIISCVPIVRKRCTTSVNIDIIGETIVIVAPYVGK
jgi:hypothetical protein